MAMAVSLGDGAQPHLCAADVCGNLSGTGTINRLRINPAIQNVLTRHLQIYIMT